METINNNTMYFVYTIETNKKRTCFSLVKKFFSIEKAKNFCNQELMKNPKAKKIDNIFSDKDELCKFANYHCPKLGKPLSYVIEKINIY